MRCPNCNKFTSLETQEPEHDLEASLTADNASVLITGSVRLVRTCADCGEEMKETTFDVEDEIDLSGQDIPEKATFDSVDIDVRDAEATESGGGRYAKNMIGYELTYLVTVPWKKGKQEGAAEIDGVLSDSAAASSFDEMV